MAIIQLGELVSNIKGSIRGTTYQRNGAGTIMRTRGITRRYSTSKQQQAHHTHLKRLGEWQNLTLTQKQAWNAYGALYDKTNKFGVTKTLNGQNWYESVNTMLEIIGEALITTPPPHDLPEAINTFEVTIVDDVFVINFTGAPDEGTSALLFWCSYVTSRSTFTINQQRKLVKVVTSDIFNAVSLKADWLTTFGVESGVIENALGKNIIVCCETVNKTSGITSSLLCSIGVIQETSPGGNYLTTNDGVLLQSNDSVPLSINQ